MAEEKKVKPATETPEAEAAKKVRKPKTTTEAVTEKPVAAAPVKAVEPKVVAAKPEVKKETATKEAPVKTKAQPAVKLTSRLQTKYTNEIRPSLFKSLKLASIMEVPKVEKIVVNVGVGDATGNSKLLEESVKELTDITGQKPVITKSKKSIATFKLRENQAIGTKVTLRGVKMYQFLDKLVSVALPRVRDFRGVSRNSFDGRGNYTLGIKEQLIFPEINFDRVNKIRGMDIVIVTTAQNDEQAYALLLALGMPFNR
jgi:large subunit ribosomal protein L5